MRASSIGIRIVTPKAATSPQRPAQQQPVDHEAEAASAVKSAPPPGTGKVVDKSL